MSERECGICGTETMREAWTIDKVSSNHLSSPPVPYYLSQNRNTDKATLPSAVTRSAVIASPRRGVSALKQTSANKRIANTPMTGKRTSEES